MHTLIWSMHWWICTDDDYTAASKTQTTTLTQESVLIKALNDGVAVFLYFYNNFLLLLLPLHLHHGNTDIKWIGLFHRVQSNEQVFRDSLRECASKPFLQSLQNVYGNFLEKFFGAIANALMRTNYFSSCNWFCLNGFKYFKFSNFGSWINELYSRCLCFAFKNGNVIEWNLFMSLTRSWSMCSSMWKF